MLRFNDGMSFDTTEAKRARTKRVRMKQLEGDDGYQYCLIIDGFVRYSGMTRSEASWRRARFIQSGEL